MLPAEVIFNFEDIPPILQRDEEARTWLLGEGTKVLFTIGENENAVQPRAIEVMPIPGPHDIIVGRVKNYGANSGYGFMRPVEDAPFTHDIFFNHRDFTTGALDQRMKLEGALCKFNVRLTPDGKGQAKAIELLAWPPGADPGPGAFAEKSLGATAAAGAGGSSESGGARSTGMKLQGVIQVYKSANGYGFIRSPKLGRDVWFPRRELPMDLVGKELLGTHVEFELWLHGDEKPHARSIHVLEEDPTEALRLDLMSGRGRGRNMTVEEKVAIWHARTGGKGFGASTSPGAAPAGSGSSAGAGSAPSMSATPAGGAAASAAST
jgi:cold shock CspA family protein